jgi:hypothetical protein
MRKPTPPRFPAARAAALLVAGSTRLAITGVAGFLLAFGSGCVFSGGGGGSDTETLTGVLLSPDGRPAANARVRLVPATYDPSRPAPGLIREAETDAAGRYTFPKAPSAGSYNLIAAVGELGLFRGDLAAGTLPDTSSLSPARVLIISLHGGIYQPADSGRAWFPGTDVIVQCDGVTATRLPAVPRGMNAMVIESRAGWRHEYTITLPNDSLAIRADSNGVTSVPY